MKQFFSFDGPLFRFLSRIFDLIVLNILFIITSIPVFTIGAGISAMSCLLTQMNRGQENYIFREYFALFRKYIKKASLPWLLFLSLSLFLTFDINLIIGMGMPRVFRLFLYFLCLILLFIQMYFFPDLVWKGNGFRKTTEDSAVISIRFLPLSLLMAALIVAPPIIFTRYFPGYFYPYLLFMAMIGFSSIGSINAFITGHVYKKEIDQKLGLPFTSG